ncbi:hypothetical protein DM02DRAFT_66522 [Periconia macrospinosa]|uniref:Uncharacterized protein n=1 Tax=Periconia macrospinosa TaxID=97972 RepID=A0A2V1DIK5_9PLEO|nr:hypothetical protein DM02DRAFT_66522 [Periconia macrospinosa]
MYGIGGSLGPVGVVTVWDGARMLNKGGRVEANVQPGGSGGPGAWRGRGGEGGGGAEWAEGRAESAEWRGCAVLCCAVLCCAVLCPVCCTVLQNSRRLGAGRQSQPLL